MPIPPAGLVNTISLSSKLTAFSISLKVKLVVLLSGALRVVCSVTVSHDGYLVMEGLL